MAEQAQVNPTSTTNPATPAATTSTESIETLDLDSGDEGADESTEAATPAVEIKKKIKSLKLKVDGNDYEEELPFEIDDDPKVIEWMKKNLQMSKMAGKRAQEKASFEKQVMSFMDDLKKNPRKALSDPRIGLDIKKFATEILEEEIANSQKSPEQLEREKLEVELRELKEQREREKEEFRQEALEREREQEFKRYDMAFDAALKSSDLPKSSYVTKKMADMMISALDAGFKVEPKDVLPLVREEIMNDIKEMFSVMPSETVQAIIGKEHMGKLRKTNMIKAKEQQAIAEKKQVVDTAKTAKVDATPAKKMSYKEFFKI